MKASQLTLAVLLTAAFGSAAHAANVKVVQAIQT